MNAPVSPPAPAPAISARKRKLALLAVAGITLVLGLAYGGYWAAYQRHFEATDNAYVQAPVVQIIDNPADRYSKVLLVLIYLRQGVKASK